ncbi:MAG: HAMP domain-containing sensor histidine kinase [Myxococcota bacterium]
MRRLLPFALSLGVGLLILLWGLVMLERIVIDEREQAHASIDEQRTTLAEHARRTLELRLQAKIHGRGEDYDRALADPFASDEDLLLIDGDRQRLPRVSQPAPGEQTPAKALYQRLRRRERPEDLERGSPPMRRSELALELFDAIDRQQRAEIASTMRAILQHRTRFVLDSGFDLPLMVAVLDELAAFSPPAPELMDGLLRHGFGEAPGARLESLQHLLLKRRGRFSTGDFEFLSERIAALSRGASVDFKDFEHAAEAPTGTPIPRPAEIQDATFIDEGRWYLAPHSSSQLRGVSVALGPLTQSLSDEMHHRGLLREEDRVSLPALPRPTTLASMPIEIDAPRLSRARREADDRFWLKTAFVVGTGLLVLIIAVLAMLLQRRRHRFVELKSDFVATVSHELRTPLASVRLMAETLERRTKDLPAAKDYPARIIRDIDGLSFLVENILSFNRLDKGRWQPRLTEVALGPLLDEILDDLDAPGGRSVHPQLEGVRGVVLRADRELMALLLRNLAINACTYNERDPITLRFEGRREGSRFRLRVHDNGVGIPAAEQGRIFEDFRRVAGTRARGSGLGLSICRKTMDAHGGRITIGSSTPQGTRFDLDFPATMVVAEP